MEATPGSLSLFLRTRLRATDEIRARIALDHVTDELALQHGDGSPGAGFSGALGAEVVLR